MNVRLCHHESGTSNAQSVEPFKYIESDNEKTINPFDYVGVNNK
jgi:hypothetical protein